MSAITTDGNLVHYEVLGRGRPVILVHGWVGSWRYWIPTLQLLQTKYRAYALDLYGFGDSAKNPKHYTLDQQVALLDEFMHQLGIPKAALIGHGLGALVVTEFARRYPDRVPRILIASAPLFDPGNLDTRQPAPPPQRPRLAQTGRLDANALNIASTLSSSSPATSASASAAMRAAMLAARQARPPNSATTQTKETPAVSATSSVPAAQPSINPLPALLESTPETLLARCFRRSEENFNKLSADLVKIDPPALGKSVENFDAGRLLDSLRLLTIPVLVVHGVDDPLLPQPNEAILNYITQDKEHLLLPILLPNVRHFPMLEDDRFARLANEFLEVPDISRLEVKERWRRRTR